MNRLKDAKSLLKQLRRSLQNSQELAEIYDRRAGRHREDILRSAREISFWENEIKRMEELNNG